LGNYQCELSRARAAGVLDDPLRLAALQAACATMEAALPERHPYPRLFQSLNTLLDTVHSDDTWLAAYVRWEVTVLGELGFGLDLGTCAVTGQAEDLAFVSPRTGRAVSRDAARPYQDKLLILPKFLITSGVSAPPEDVLAGFRLTGWFLQNHVLAALGGRLPPARERLIARIDG
jgi:DNA repair protein RecO (recombination protein O)